MPASMASVSMRKVASPRNIVGAFKSPGGAFKSPKVSLTVSAVPYRVKEEPWSPHSVSLLKNSPSLSPNVINALSPYCNPRSCVVKVSPVSAKSSRCARKLPWSDGGEHSSSLRNRADSVPAHTDLLDSVIDCCRYQPSADTPDRADLLEEFKEKNSKIHILGKGSFGTVIEAIYRGKAVAVKIISSSAEACRQIKNEMHCLNLNHPNIVSVLKVTPPYNDIAGIVIMERVAGYSLQKLIDDDLFINKVHKRLRYSMHISSALAYCHESGVLHLDVKPQNVLVDLFSDSCKLCDFGCSSNFQTEQFFLQGTIGYAAPEVLQGHNPTSAADVYSLGITMWQLMSGESPYKDLRGHTVIYRVVAAEYRPPLPEIVCQEDEQFASLITRCWSQTAKLRPTVQDVLEELSIEYKKVKP